MTETQAPVLTKPQPQAIVTVYANGDIRVADGVTVGTLQDVIAMLSNMVRNVRLSGTNGTAGPTME